MTDDIRHEMGALVPRLRRFAWGLSGSRDDGDDLVQAACARALARLDQFQPGTRLDSWMFRIIQTLWLDEKRRQRVRGVAPDPDTLPELSDDGVGARAPQDRLTLARVRAEVAALPPDQRAVLILVAVEGLSYREAAETLDVPVGTVMSRLSRARAKLLATV